MIAKIIKLLGLQAVCGSLWRHKLVSRVCVITVTATGGRSSSALQVQLVSAIMREFRWTEICLYALSPALFVSKDGRQTSQAAEL